MTKKTGLGENPLEWIKSTKKVENQKSRKPENKKTISVEQYISRKVENQRSRSFKDDKDQISLWLPKQLVTQLKLESARTRTKISELVKEALSTYLRKHS